MPSTGKLAELKGRIQEQLNAQIKQANEHLVGLKGRAEHAQDQAAADLRAGRRSGPATSPWWPTSPKRGSRPWTPGWRR